MQTKGFLSAFALCFVLALSACGGGGGGKASPDQPPPADTIANPFSFPAKNGVAKNVDVVSDPIAVSGLGNGVSVPVSIGDRGSFSVNGGAFTTTTGTVKNGDQVRVKVRSSIAPSTAVSATLAVGTVSGRFTVTTAADPVPGRRISVVTKWTQELVTKLGPGGGFTAFGFTAFAVDGAKLTDFYGLWEGNDLDHNKVLGVTTVEIPKPEGGGDIPKGYDELIDRYAGDAYNVLVRLYKKQSDVVETKIVRGVMEDGVVRVGFGDLSAFAGDSLYGEWQINCPMTPAKDLYNQAVVYGAGGRTADGTGLENLLKPGPLTNCSTTAPTLAKGPESDASRHYLDDKRYIVLHYNDPTNPTQYESDWVIHYVERE